LHFSFYCATIVAEIINEEDKMIQKFKEKFIGTKAFYRSVLAIVIPMIIQNGISNFVNLLDNIMVGSLGTEAMSGVSIVNQFTFVFMLLVFGSVSAAGIFTAQYHGKGDVESVRHTFRAKLIINTIVGILGVVVFLVFEDQFINMFLHESDSTGDLALTLQSGKDYLNWILIGLIPFAISQVYASTLRETGNTVVPMAASISAVLTNLVFNALLIFGLLGLPALGVAGAAIATTISRFVELIILVVYTHTKAEKHPFIIGAYKSLYIPKELMAKIAVKGLPIMANEFFWSLSITIRNQSYATRGLDVVAAINIAFTIINLMNVVFLSLGSSISIIVGNQLGAGKIEEAKSSAYKMLAFSIFGATCMGILQICISPFFPLIYNTTDTVRHLATFVIIASACASPFNAFAHASYFTLRSGGRVIETLLFDSVYAWVAVIPTAFLLSRLTTWSFQAIFISVVIVEALKCIMGVIFVKKEHWAKQLTVND
jgi:putative MATE family efflux protein